MRNDKQERQHLKWQKDGRYQDTQSRRKAFLEQKKVEATEKKPTRKYERRVI